MTGVVGEEPKLSYHESASNFAFRFFAVGSVVGLLSHSPMRGLLQGLVMALVYGWFERRYRPDSFRFELSRLPKESQSRVKAVFYGDRELKLNKTEHQRLVKYATLTRGA